MRDTAHEGGQGRLCPAVHLQQRPTQRKTEEVPNSEQGGALPVLPEACLAPVQPRVDVCHPIRAVPRWSGWGAVATRN